MVPDKDLPKVKLEKFHNSKVLEQEEIMRTLVCEGFRVFIVCRVDISSLAQKIFPCREDLH